MRKLLCRFVVLSAAAGLLLFNACERHRPDALPAHGSDHTDHKKGDAHGHGHDHAHDGHDHGPGGHTHGALPAGPAGTPGSTPAEFFPVPPSPAPEGSPR